MKLNLSLRFGLMLTLFVFVIACVVALTIVLGFRHTQESATVASANALIEREQSALLQTIQLQATTNDLILQRAADNLIYGALILQTQARIDRNIVALPTQLANGQWQIIGEHSTVFVGVRERLSDVTIDDIMLSSALDDVFTPLIDTFENVAAMYYISPDGVTRYYPAKDLVSLLGVDFFAEQAPPARLARPENNPDRAIRWTAAYIDDADLGAVVTASYPVYVDDVYRGSVGVDITLNELIERLNQIQPTPDSYTFLIDTQANLVAAPPLALRQLLGTETPDVPISIETTLGIPLVGDGASDIMPIVQQMTNGETGIQQMTIQGEQVLIAYAPLTSVGWSMATVVSIAEISVPANQVEATIMHNASRTLQVALVTIAIVLLFALAASMIIVQRYFVQPIIILVEGTQQVATGDFDTMIDVQTDDEFSTLARAFNFMAHELNKSRQDLEQRVLDRTRDLQLLYETTASANRLNAMSEVFAETSNLLLDKGELSGVSVYLVDAHQGLQCTFQTGEAIDNDLIQQMWDNRLVVAGNHQLVLPIMVDSSVCGGLALRKANAFTPEQIRLFNTIAEQLGVTLEKQHLREQSENLILVEERQRLARELHDAVTQSVFSVTLMASAARKNGERGQLDGLPDLLLRLEEIGQQALKEMRLLVYELRPLALQQDGLVGALQHRLDAVEGRAGIKTKFRIDGDLCLTHQQEHALFRIAQEALNNSLKYAEASSVSVQIIADEAYKTLTIVDDGIGFDTSQQRAGVGLNSMSERAQQLGATLIIDSQPSMGTTITVIIPINDEMR